MKSFYELVLSICPIFQTLTHTNILGLYHVICISYWGLPWHVQHWKYYIVFILHLLGHSKILCYIMFYGKNHLHCILILVLHCFKRNEIYVLYVLEGDYYRIGYFLHLQYVCRGTQKYSVILSYMNVQYCMLFKKNC